MINLPTAKPPIPITALLTRIAIVGLGVALFIGEAQGVAATSTWFSLLAPAFFLAALWAASNTLAWIGRGDEFGAAMVRGLTSMGGFLMLGAFCAIVVQPAMIFLVGNGFTELRGVRFEWTVENIALVLVGLVLMLLARQGRKLKSKLDEFV